MAHHRRYPRRRTPDMIPFIFVNGMKLFKDMETLNFYGDAMMKSWLPTIQPSEDSKGFCVYEKPEVFAVVGYLHFGGMVVPDSQRRQDAKRYTDHGPPNPN